MLVLGLRRAQLYVQVAGPTFEFEGRLELLIESHPFYVELDGGYVTLFVYRFRTDQGGAFWTAMLFPCSCGGVRLAYL